jgi:hypothetical protein
MLSTDTTSLLRLAIAAAAIVLPGCGVIAHQKPIPAGTPTAFIHVGPVKGGLKTQSIHVFDGLQCKPGEFNKTGIIGSYLGSDYDVEVPAHTKLFFNLVEKETGILHVVECGNAIVMHATPGMRYTMNLVYTGEKCDIVVKQTATGELVKTEMPSHTCDGQ